MLVTKNVDSFRFEKYAFFQYRPEFQNKVGHQLFTNVTKTEFDHQHMSSVNNMITDIHSAWIVDIIFYFGGLP